MRIFETETLEGKTLVAEGLDKLVEIYKDDCFAIISACKSDYSDGCGGQEEDRMRSAELLEDLRSAATPAYKLAGSGCNCTEDHTAIDITLTRDTAYFIPKPASANIPQFERFMASLCKKYEQRAVLVVEKGIMHTLVARKGLTSTTSRGEKATPKNIQKFYKETMKHADKKSIFVIEGIVHPCNLISKMAMRKQGQKWMWEGEGLEYDPAKFVQTTNILKPMVESTKLPNTKWLTLYHYSTVDQPKGIMLDPKKFGSNAYTSHVSTKASVVPRTYFYVNPAEREKWFKTGAHLYVATVASSSVYDLTKDPAGLFRKFPFDMHSVFAYIAKRYDGAFYNMEDGVGIVVMFKPTFAKRAKTKNR